MAMVQVLLTLARFLKKRAHGFIFVCLFFIQILWKIVGGYKFGFRCPGGAFSLLTLFSWSVQAASYQVALTPAGHHAATQHIAKEEKCWKDGSGSSWKSSCVDLPFVDLPIISTDIWTCSRPPLPYETRWFYQYLDPAAGAGGGTGQSKLLLITKYV